MSNPILTNKNIQKYITEEQGFEVMSVSGVALKSVFMLSVLALFACFTYSLVFKGFIDKANMLGTVGLFGGLITAFIIIFSRNFKIMAPLTIVYSAFEGLAIGGLSAFVALQVNSLLVFNAVFATFGTLFAMLFLYSAKIIKCTEKFKGTVIAATFGVLVIYLVSMIMSFFNPQASSLLMGNGAVGIGFSIVVCLIAAFNFIVDFDIIENAKNAGVNKDFEWYGAFSIMVTLIWLYVEIINLLLKLNSRNN